MQLEEMRNKRIELVGMVFIYFTEENPDKFPYLTESEHFKQLIDALKCNLIEEAGTDRVCQHELWGQHCGEVFFFCRVTLEKIVDLKLRVWQLFPRHFKS